MSNNAQTARTESWLSYKMLRPLIVFPILGSSVVLVLVVTVNRRKNMQPIVRSDKDYLEERFRILSNERQQFLGGEINLTPKEDELNKIILMEKQMELKNGHENITKFLPSRHFFNAKRDIENSKVYSYINKIPKGASLHTHLLAAVNTDYILERITYRDNLYGCFINNVFKLRFLSDPVADKPNAWQSLKTYRANDPDFDTWLRQQFSLEVEKPQEMYPTAAVIWQRFKKIFTSQYDMLCYRPVFEQYITQLLMELYVDNVFYTELRGTFMPLYELDGTTYDNKQFFDIFIEIVENFKIQYPDFLGVRYIHSVYRGVAPEVLEVSLNDLIAMKKLYPNFIAGFDFVGYEEEGYRMLDYSQILQNASKDLKFFFHAGETNWFGSTDLNLVDAILLDSSRIGHGFGISKHPVLMEMAKIKEIAIELCPISNQVLKLNEDHRNHPVINLLANNYPVVICNDDPSVWGATGLSYDWYIVFMAMVPEDAGIEVIKQFAINSIQYSAMSNDEKVVAMEKWKQQWQTFLNTVVK